MRVFYGGSTSAAAGVVGSGAVELKLATMTDFVREAVYTEDQTTYLWDDVGMRCICWLNSGATVINPVGGVGSPVLTATALVQILQQDRKQLLVTMETGLGPGNPTQVFLQSPYPGATTDAKFGPKCIVRDFNLNHGNGSIVLDLEFHTSIAPCGGVSSTAKSVRWDH